MKYNRIPRARPTKGTSKRIRRTLDGLLRYHFSKPEVQEAISRDVLDQIMFGRSFMEFHWDEELQDVGVKRIDPTLEACVALASGGRVET